MAPPKKVQSPSQFKSLVNRMVKSLRKQVNKATDHLERLVVEKEEWDGIAKAIGVEPTKRKYTKRKGKKGKGGRPKGSKNAPKKVKPKKKAVKVAPKKDDDTPF